MLRNYVKIAWRTLMKNKVFSFINVVGLTVGMACCILIAAFVTDELSYDKYPAQANQMYRVELHLTENERITDFSNVDAAVGPGIKAEFPEVLAATRLLQWGQVFMRYQDKQFKEQSIAMADSNFLELFSIPLLEGNIKTALKEPGSIVVTKAFAQKYFGNSPAMGKALLFGKGQEVRKVTGVIDKIPSNTHFHFDAFLSTTDLGIKSLTWSNVGFYTYLVLSKDADPQKLEAKFPQLVARYVVPEIQRDMGVSLAEAQKSVDTFRFTLMPLTDIHLHSATKYELAANGDIKSVYIFSILAVFILLLAIVNFTNLSTASAASRSKEIGIRKVMGSVRTQLIKQFLIESTLLTFFALLLAAGVVALLLPYFNTLSGKDISISMLLSVTNVAMLLAFGGFVGILAGAYPAFLLSFSRITTVLKGGSAVQTSRRSSLRSGLVVFQFAVSGTLIVATMVTYQQLHFMQNKKIGFDKDQVLVIQDSYMLGQNEQVFKEQLQKDSRVIQASLSGNIPVGMSNMDGTQIYAKRENGKEQRAEIHTNIYHVDEEYLKTLGMDLKEGRTFSKDFSTDSTATVINEAAVRDLGLGKTSPIGKTIVRSGQREFTIIGVVKDFHYASTRQKIAPLMMILGRNSGAIIVKVKGTDAADIVASFRKQWEAFNPPAPFTYSFLDERFAFLYESEQKTSQLFTVFAVISVVIASLGLFGLAAFTAEQRTKEIGVRKVLGASVVSIIALLSKDFLKLVLIAIVLAVPIAWLAMNRWLSDFAYRIDIEWWVFALAGLLAVGIALFTISFQSIKAALMNPIKSLRSE
ncbi:ABC transporter permease [Spirosoma endophyticum]|uniref:Putative ABC transport system permease protein n=1 Tax=Spirosoma endophyticum TaxID=662367 RepID=A0A1I1VD75_9BACT|nr:ABC transporter permease [Spirosoma endophyticum]SFD80947.1 putative ABC transport system permease protein [Spirosoma endophyticum]